MAHLIDIFSVQNVVLFLLILIRISGLLVLSPFFNQPGIPQRVKIYISVVIALVLFPVVTTLPNGAAAPYPKDLIQFTVTAFQEFAIGGLIGFAVELVFTGIRMTGEFLGSQMGLQVASLMDPAGAGALVPIVSHFYFILAMLVFLNLNIHHVILIALGRSFQTVPLGSGHFPIEDIAQRFIVLSGDMFLISLMLALPVTGLLFIVELGLAFVAKVMPQMNVFMVAIPVKVAIGLAAMAISFPMSAEYLVSEYEDLGRHLMLLFKTASS